MRFYIPFCIVWALFCAVEQSKKPEDNSELWIAGVFVFNAIAAPLTFGWYLFKLYQLHYKKKED